MCVIRMTFFFNDTSTTEIYTLSLHDALPILEVRVLSWAPNMKRPLHMQRPFFLGAADALASEDRIHGAKKGRSEEHTSELQSHLNLVCRLLLEKKNRQRKVA